MRNTITINGVSSTTITGLLIQTLPPITKPLMRTNIEEIDGRPGDVITELGYSAYDKTFTIGLYGSFDINQVISFFATSGTVIFSNESDKYYSFNVLARIDFERLVRFRTAEVTFHVQPYKYPVTETPITGTSSLTVVNSGNAPALPRIGVSGSGNVGISLNGEQIFALTLDTNDSLTIDCAEMEASGDGVLRNRSVVGNYSNFVIAPGTSTVTISGTVTNVTISNYIRWI